MKTRREENAISNAEQDEQLIHHASYELVRADDSDPRAWLQDSPECLLLKKHHIAHVGVMHAKAPFRVTRANPSGTYMMACIEGRGNVLVDGRWESLEKNQACLLPPFVMNRFMCRPEEEWKFCWVRYSESREQIPLISSISPVLGEYFFAPLHYAIQGLRAEVLCQQLPSSMEKWINIIHENVLAFAQPQHSDERITRLWREVEKNLANDWTLDQMASMAHVSTEHLRRLCRRHLGRSPLQQLTFLRMQMAQKLLHSTNQKVETVAQAVGYQSAFTFSNNYKKWIGWRPSEHR